MSERNGLGIDLEEVQRQFQRQKLSALAPPCDRYLRLVAERGGEIVGTAVAHDHLFAPRGWLVVRVFVDQSNRGRGVGRDLSSALDAELSDMDLSGVQCLIPEGNRSGRRWAERRGFTRCLLEFTYTTDTGALRISSAEASRSLPPGITLHSMADSMGEDRARLFELMATLLTEVPGMRGSPAPPPQMVEAAVTRMVSRAPDVSSVATRSRRPVGIVVAGWDGDDGIHSWFTGVAPGMRGMGIARALRVRVLEKARAMGIRRVWGHVAATNAEMLAVNDRLGCSFGDSVWVMRRPARSHERAVAGLKA